MPAKSVRTRSSSPARSGGSNTKKARWVSYSWLLINTVAWGSSFVLVKPALSVTTPFRYMFYRYILAILLSTPILWYYVKKISWKKIKKITPTVFSLELLGTALALSLLYLGLKYSTALEAGLIATLQPLFVTIGGILLLNEKEERHEWIGTFVALGGGLLLVLGPGFVPSSPRFSLLGNLLITLSLVVNMFYFPWAKKAYQGQPKFLVSTLSYYLGLVAFGVLSLIEVGLPQVLISSIWTDLQSTSVWIASGYMALFGSIIGLTAYIKGQDGIEASEAGMFWYLQPLVSVPLAFLVFGDTILPVQILGMALVFAGVFLAERRVL